MKIKIKRMFFWFFTGVVIYLITGLVIHYLILPIKKPDFADYFKAKISFSSKLEGITQTAMQQEGAFLITKTIIHPKAAGPVAHSHENFEEVFTVQEGELSLQVGTELKKIKPGETIIVPKNTPHKPFNTTDSAVTLTCRIPLTFAFCLSQLYPFWDANQKNTKPPKLLFQLAVYGSDFDSYPVENSPPKPMLKFLKFILAPTARLLGYQYYQQ